MMRNAMLLLFRPLLSFLAFVHTIHTYVVLLNCHLSILLFLRFSPSSIYLHELMELKEEKRRRGSEGVENESFFFFIVIIKYVIRLQGFDICYGWTDNMELGRKVGI